MFVCQQMAIYFKLLRNQLIIRRNVVDLAYKMHGGNPKTEHAPIIVLHGLLGSKKNWESVSHKLASEMKTSVVAVDSRNHGESPHDSSHSYKDMASDVSQLINKLSFKQAVLIGHSMGGRTAMVLALAQPDIISSLIVVDVSPVSAAGLRSNFFPNLLDAMSTVDFTGATNLREAKTIAKEKLKNIVHEATLAFILMNVGEKATKHFNWVCNIESLKSYYNEIAQFPSDMLKKQYKGPTLFIGGDESDYIPPGDIDGIKLIFPKAILQYVTGVGHNVHAENPTAFIKLVKDFLNK